MPDFNITRDEALATVPAKIAAIKYLTAMAAWQHESGPWLVISHTPAHPTNYAVHWRSSQIWQAGHLHFVAAFQEKDYDLAWERALKSAETAWTKGPVEVLRQKAKTAADNYSAAQSANGTKGGNASAETRSKQAEERAEAARLAAKFGIDKKFMPHFDPRDWTFNPGTNLQDLPTINFTWKKQQQTYAHLTLAASGQAWEIERGWYPDGNNDNARIEEICFREIEDTDKALEIFTRLLKSDPSKWMRGDYTRFE